MARLAAILRALGRVVWREQKSIGSLAGNNFFFFSLVALQEAGAFIYLIIGLVILFPLSTDPLRRIPASRLELWPLTRGERRILRVVSPWVNPMTWAVAALAVWMLRGKVSVGLWGLLAGIVAGVFAISMVPWAGRQGIWRRVPEFPGPLNQLIRRNLRAILSTLDIYCALLLSVSMLAFRLFLPPLPREALLVVTILADVALSSYAQCLFGLDGKSGLTRYRLLPLPGWQILAAKDAAFLVVAMILSLPLAPLAGMGAALMALATGHANSVNNPRVQVRWRFSAGGPILPDGLMQVVAMAMAASSIYLYSALLLFPCVAVWIFSMWWYGRLLG